MGRVECCFVWLYLRPVHWFVAQLIGYTCTVSILCSNVRVLVAKLVKTSDWDWEDLSLNLQRIAHDFRPQSTEDLDRLIARSRKNCRQLLIRKYWQVLFCMYLLTWTTLPVGIFINWSIFFSICITHRYGYLSTSSFSSEGCSGSSFFNFSLSSSVKTSRHVCRLSTSENASFCTWEETSLCVYRLGTY